MNLPVETARTRVRCHLRVHQALEKSPEKVSVSRVVRFHVGPAGALAPDTKFHGRDGPKNGLRKRETPARGCTRRHSGQLIFHAISSRLRPERADRDETAKI